MKRFAALVLFVMMFAMVSSAGWASVSITTTSLKNGRFGKPYDAAIEAQGAVSFTISKGELPTGLALSPLGGHISGRPTEAGNFTFTVRAAARDGSAATREFNIYVLSTTEIPAQFTGVWKSVYALELSLIHI